jgi:hypothetical protein
VPVGPAARTPYLDTGWYSEDDWEDASLFDVVVDDGQLHASMKDGLTLSGTWIDSVDLYKGSTAPAINSVNIWWEGKNETVEASVDGTTWAAVTKGVNLSVIPSGFNATDKALYIRITFPTGVDEAYVDYMRVRGYIGNTATSANRTITYNNATVLLAENHPALLREDTGVQINSGGSVVIGPELSSTPTPIRTIELWVKPSATTTATLGTTSSAIYKNGVTGTDTLNANEWVVYHRVLSANLTGSLTIDVPGQVAKVALYDTALSAAQVSAIVDNYTGTDKSRYDGTGLISITESATSTTIYAHDWEILTA